MNYFIDTDNMEIEEKNIFTAIELSSLTIVHGVKEYAQMLKDNYWVINFLPNEYLRFNKPCAITDKSSIIKKISEFILNHFFADKLNEKLMLITDKRWQKKWTKKNYPMADYPLAFKTTLHISKNHPANHQKKVLNTLKEVGFAD